MKSVILVLEDNKYESLSYFCKISGLTVEDYLMKLINATVSPFDIDIKTDISIEDFKQKF